MEENYRGLIRKNAAGNRKRNNTQIRSERTDAGFISVLSYLVLLIYLANKFKKGISTQAQNKVNKNEIIL